jgi:hypothetical protein
MEIPMTMTAVQPGATAPRAIVLCDGEAIDEQAFALMIDSMLTDTATSGSAVAAQWAIHTPTRH